MGSSVDKAVANLYDSMSEREWTRRTAIAPSFMSLCGRCAGTRRPTRPCPGFGGGPGRYAVELARWGYDVTLFDSRPATWHWRGKRPPKRA